MCSLRFLILTPPPRAPTSSTQAKKGALDAPTFKAICDAAAEEYARRSFSTKDLLTVDRDGRIPFDALRDALRQISAAREDETLCKRTESYILEMYGGKPSMKASRTYNASIAVPRTFRVDASDDRDREALAKLYTKVRQ